MNNSTNCISCEVTNCAHHSAQNTCMLRNVSIGCANSCASVECTDQTNCQSYCKK